MNNRSKNVAPAYPRKPRRADRLPLKVLALATVCALHALPTTSLAQSIGALDVRSRVGEAFFAAVPVQAADGILDPRCIRVLPNPNAPEGAAALKAVRVRIGSADSVLIETAGTVESPVVGLRLEVGCEKSVARDFVVVDERPSPSERSAVAQGDFGSARGAAVGSGAASTQSVPARRAQRTNRAPVGLTVPARQDLARPAHSPAPSRMSAAPAAASASDAAGARRVAELRARSDDQAAALLALDDRLALLQRQAEALKLQLEQRLGVVPPGGSGQPGAAAVASAAVPSATTPWSPAPSTMASVAPTAQFPGHSEAASSGASTGGASAAPIATASASSTPAAVVSPAAASPLAVTQHAPRSAFDLLSDWKVAGGLGALLLGALAFKLRRRPTFKDAPAAIAPERDWESVAEDLIREHARTQPIPAMTDASGSPLTNRTSGVDPTAEWIAPPTTDSLPVPSAREGRATLPGGAMTRESHLAQTFQPDAEHLVARASPDEIVQQARTHYMEDADLFKAIDLLEMAVAARKDSVRPWQALFAIYRREKMPERFQRLANAYRKTFGTDESWSAILALGREIDPANPLYAALAGGAPLPEDLVERWLGVPLDFTAHLLANEMHDELMDTSAGHKRGKRPTGE